MGCCSNSNENPGSVKHLISGAAEEMLTSQ